MSDKLSMALEERARREGRSLNRTAQDLLISALGLKEKEGMERNEDFREFAGMWSEEEASEFNASVETLSTIDAEDWS